MPDRAARRRRGAVAGILFGLSPLVLHPGALAAHDTTKDTRSFYIGTTSTSTLNHLGCETGQKGRRGDVVLLFGSPVSVSGTFGATVYGAANQTTTGVSNLAKQFIKGFHDCSSGSGYLFVDIGITNCLIGGAQSSICAGSQTTTWIRNHGEAWGNMVNSVASWATAQGYNDRVLVSGAWDMEPSWSSFDRADKWMHGYNFDASGPGLAAIYSADGCPQSSPLNSATNGACNNGWTQDRMWHEAWDHPVALPFPQIYTTNSSQAKQWKHISEFAYHAHGAPMWFYGALSQYLACGCGSQTNSNHAAATQLRDQLNAHSHTANGYSQWTSDISWDLHDH